jgi:hypothetical protein
MSSNHFNFEGLSQEQVSASRKKKKTDSRERKLLILKRN